MPHEVTLIPHASSLMESMRSVGYSLEAALADVLDNSISASASRVDIQFRSSGDPYIAICDNGHGMRPDELEGAMQYGSRSPLDTRGVTDMGRYGLGLKTASLSQCRNLTVISLRDGVLSGRCWDLDLVSRRNSWVLLCLEASELSALPHVEELKSAGSGTIVLWRQLDRLLAGESSVEVALGHKMDVSRHHLAKVFHRYIAGESGISKVAVTLNLDPLPLLDPFLEGHAATQRLDEEKIHVEGHRVTVKPFILPHISKLSATDLRRAGGTEDLRTHQGFYVYRNRRLIISGTWFRLARKGELSKLARVRVDIPNSLDHLWTLDIKKSAAHPPEAVRNNLSRTVERIAECSQRTYTHRGRATPTGAITFGWTRLELRERAVRYDINREHPAIASVLERLDLRDRQRVGSMLDLIEATFPADALYADMAGDSRTETRYDEESATLRLLVSTLISDLPKGSAARTALLASLHRLEPFSAHPELAKLIATENS